MSAPFTCTFEVLRNFAALTRRRVDLSPEGWAEEIRTRHAPTKSALSLIFAGLLGDDPVKETGCTRHDGNVKWLTAIPSDYDGEQISFDTVLAILTKARIFCLIYTSPSHDPLRPRWRIIAFLSHPLPPSEHTRLVARLNGLVGGVIDPGSFTLSRSYYFGYVGDGAHHRVEIVPGDFIDLRDDLDAGAIGKPNGIDPRMNGAFSSRLDEERAIKGIITGENIYPNLISLAGKRAHEGVPWLETQRFFESLFDGIAPGERPERWQKRRDEIPRILKYVYGKEIERRSEEPEFTIHGNSASHRAPGAESTHGDASGREAGAEAEPDAAAGATEGGGAPEPDPDPSRRFGHTQTEFHALEMPLADHLLGSVFSTSMRGILIGPTGSGKTMLMLDMAVAMAEGKPFLHWPGSGKQRWVLYYDAEMPVHLFQKRSIDAARRNGGEAGTLILLSAAELSRRYDFIIPPINTLAGQVFIEQQIAAYGGFDFIFFDNIQGLLAGDLREPESWRPVLAWVRKLTNQGIGQLWAHHTGHDTSHGYGDKTKEWQMDAVLIIQQAVSPGADLALTVEFTKARERMPDNRDEFESVLVTLADDTWSVSPLDEGGANPRKASGEDRAFELLVDEIARHGVIPQLDDEIPSIVPCVKEEAWKNRYLRSNISDATPENAARQFRRLAQRLINNHRVGMREPWVWIIRR